MKHNSKSYYISAFKRNLPDDVNLQRNTSMLKDIMNITHNVVGAAGKYKGEQELSWIIGGSGITEEQVLELANKYEQECVLVVHGIDSMAELLFTNNVRMKLGTMVSTNDYKEVEGKDFTLSNNTFYYVK